MMSVAPSVTLVGGTTVYELGSIAVWFGSSSRPMRILVWVMILTVVAMGIFVGSVGIVRHDPVSKLGIIAGAFVFFEGILVVVALHFQPPPEVMEVHPDRVEFGSRLHRGFVLAPKAKPVRFMLSEQVFSSASQVRRPFRHELRIGLSQRVVPLTGEAFAALVSWCDVNGVPRQEGERVFSSGEVDRNLYYG